MIAKTPIPPYYAVIFSSVRTEDEHDIDSSADYAHMANKMMELAAEQEGFLGVEAARNDLGITVSYWKDLVSIREWKNNTEHMVAQSKGRSVWYSHYKTRICKVERDYEWNL